MVPATLALRPHTASGAHGDRTAPEVVGGLAWQWDADWKGGSQCT